jgi:hypothetical protein
VPIHFNRIQTLRAAIDRIIPADDFPSASQAGVDHFIVALLAGDRKNDAEVFDAGLAALDAEAQIAEEKSFADCPGTIQDQILERVQQGLTRAQWKAPATQFVDMLLNLTAEGYFSDPANGGNRNAVSWSMVGYDPGANRP